MDIWEKLYLEARKQFHPEEINPFIYAHHVVCALESENGDIFTGFCIESCCGVMDAQKELQLLICILIVDKQLLKS